MTIHLTHSSHFKISERMAAPVRAQHDIGSRPPVAPTMVGTSEGTRP